MLTEAITAQRLKTDKNFPQVSFIVPCLNGTNKLAAGISNAKRALNEQQ
jgi:hypothetical protein